jgi:hypothetical protein
MPVIALVCRNRLCRDPDPAEQAMIAELIMPGGLGISTGNIIRPGAGVTIFGDDPYARQHGQPGLPVEGKGISLVVPFRGEGCPFITDIHFACLANSNAGRGFDIGRQHMLKSASGCWRKRFGSYQAHCNFISIANDLPRSSFHGAGLQYERLFL